MTPIDTNNDNSDNSEQHDSADPDFFYGFDDPEFEQVYSLCEQWCTDQKIEGGAYQSDRAENIARAFEEFVKKEHADVAEMVKKDAGIYESAFAEWCANDHSQSDDDDDDDQEEAEDDNQEEAEDVNQKGAEENDDSKDKLNTDATPASDVIQSVQTGDVQQSDDHLSAQREETDSMQKESDEKLESPAKRLKTQ